MQVCKRHDHIYSTETIIMRKLILLSVLVMATVITDKLPNVPTKKIPLSKPTPVELFMKRIAMIESGGKYTITNEFGMMGKYQFSPGTVRALGFKVTQKEFLQNPQLQDSVMLAYMKANHDELEPIINKYNGKTVNGIKITRAGILAGAHFAGTTGVAAYLRGQNGNFVDARGTTITKYMAYFSDFQLPKI